ncbi:hypothetical protein MHYP_G00262400 [Metynnis hypsauchen]
MKHIMKFSIFFTFTVQLSTADTHSLEYFLTGVTPGTRSPEFTAVGQVDGLQGGYYNSNFKKLVLTADWLKNNDDVKHWNFMTQVAQSNEESFKLGLSYLMKLFNQTGGIHTWQGTTGCELHDDGTKSGYSKNGYDGEDFLSLDLNSLTWTAANAIAVSSGGFTGIIIAAVVTVLLIIFGVGGFVWMKKKQSVLHHQFMSLTTHIWNCPVHDRDGEGDHE